MKSAPVLALAAVLLASACLLGAQPATGTSLDAALAASSVINVDSQSFPGHEAGGVVPARADALLDLYEVPADRWLLVTDFETSGGPFQLVEVAGTTETTKRGPYFFNFGAGGPAVFVGYHSSVGLAFAPGTRVALRNLSQAPALVTFTLTGHLSRQ
ncbi:MAG TPA: hypothetical protein VFD43_11655 [Planctomycetota bacterium]|nr:hypothetical protein [Planctomycetota bacterium]